MVIDLQFYGTHSFGYGNAPVGMSFCDYLGAYVDECLEAVRELYPKAEVQFRIAWDRQSESPIAIHVGQGDDEYDEDSVRKAVESSCQEILGRQDFVG